MNYVMAIDKNYRNAADQMIYYLICVNLKI